MLTFLKTKKHSADFAFLYKGKKISWREFCANISALAKDLQKSDVQNWALYNEDSFLFAIGFFALLTAKKTIILPHNIQVKTLELLADTKLLSDISFEQNFVLEANSIFEISPDAEIIFFTSGSTGTPKKIHKKFSQLEQEISDLEKLWPINAELLASSVSHQHIYGLLFRLLLPLQRGILINSITTFSPEELNFLTRDFSKITLVSSPAFLKRLSLNDVFKSDFDYVFSSGGLLARATAENSAKIFKTFPMEILGSTETGGVAWRSQESGDVWTKFSAVKIKISEPDSLLVQSPYVGSKNYLAMGDSAEILDEQHFLLKGRSDRIVKIEEKRISLDEIENALRENDLVANCHAAIVEGKRQAIGVIIELGKKGKIFLQENGRTKLNVILREFLLQYFEPIVIPRKWRYESLPLNSQGKLIHEKIKEIFAHESVS